MDNPMLTGLFYRKFYQIHSGVLEPIVTDIRNRLSKYGYLFALITTIAIITAAGYGFVQQQKQIVIEDTRHELAMIADLKASQIVSWRRERQIEAASIFANTMISHRIAEHLKGPEEAAVRAELQTWMKGIRDTAGYTSLMLYRPDGSLITSDPPETDPSDRHYLDQIEQAVKKQDVVFNDLHYDAVAEEVDIDMSIPIMRRENGLSRCIAVLLIDIAPQKYLYPLIRSWPSPSFSGETLLVRRDGNDVLYLNTLRFMPDSALRYRVPLTRTEMPAVRAALGQEGVFEGIDYRGVRVFSSTRTIPDSSWAIVTKIDMQEMLEPVSRRIWYVVGVCLLVILATVLALSLRWRHKQESYLLTLYDAELNFNRELKQAEQDLLNANTLLEERVAARTVDIVNSNTQLRQEIAERKQVEDLLRKYFHVIQQSPIAIIITDLNGAIEFANPKFSEFSGYSYEEVIGQNPRILKTDITAPVTHTNLWETITVGNTWQGEFCNRKKSGELFWEYAKILPIKDQKGTITNYMAFKEDITRHKQLEEKLLQSRKLETIGQIAGGVAHEVRNPLNAILSITEALFREKEIEGNLEFVPYIQHIRTQVNRLATLMNDLLDLGKPISPAEFQDMPLLHLCRETLDLWKASGMASNRQATIIAGQDAVTILVRGDHNKLQQVIFNLLENAGYHCTADSPISLHLAETLPDEGMAVVRVVDAGRGIPEENLARLFEPFYSDRKGGTGLGLPLVQHFIENMGGSIRIYNNDPPPGCTAELHIPLSARELT
jgi:PAS domain S-box-containing protein